MVAKVPGSLEQLELHIGEAVDAMAAFRTLARCLGLEVPALHSNWKDGGALPNLPQEFQLDRDGNIQEAPRVEELQIAGEDLHQRTDNWKAGRTNFTSQRLRSVRLDFLRRRRFSLSVGKTEDNLHILRDHTSSDLNL